MIRRKAAGMFALMFVLTGINTSLQPYYAAEARQEQTQEILENAKDEMIAGEYVPGEAIVTLDAVGLTSLTREGTASFDSHIQIEAVYDFGESEDDKNKNSYVVHLSSDKYTTEELMERALDFYYVDNVSANGYQHLCSDAFTDYQWYLDGNSTQMTTASPGIRYSQMTATTKGTPVIAVLDTGVNYNHEDLKSQIEEKGWVSVSDPACGAGALLLAFANECKRNHINYQTSVFFVAQDIDFLAGCMCYIQMSLLGCPGYVVIDDSILHPAQSYDEDGLIPKNSPNVWFTPMYFRDIWHWRRMFAQLDLITQDKK